MMKAHAIAQIARLAAFLAFSSATVVSAESLHVEIRQAPNVEARGTLQIHVIDGARAEVLMQETRALLQERGIGPVLGSELATATSNLIKINLPSETVEVFEADLPPRSVFRVDYEADGNSGIRAYLVHREKQDEDYFLTVDLRRVLTRELTVTWGDFALNESAFVQLSSAPDATGKAWRSTLSANSESTVRFSDIPLYDSYKLTFFSERMRREREIALQPGQLTHGTLALSTVATDSIKFYPKFTVVDTEDRPMSSVKYEVSQGKTDDQGELRHVGVTNQDGLIDLREGLVSGTYTLRVYHGSALSDDYYTDQVVDLGPGAKRRPDLEPIRLPVHLVPVEASEITRFLFPMVENRETGELLPFVRGREGEFFIALPQGVEKDQIEERSPVRIDRPSRLEALERMKERSRAKEQD